MVCELGGGRRWIETVKSVKGGAGSGFDGRCLNLLGVQYEDVKKLVLAGDKTTRPDDHIAYFAGEHPCNADGTEIAGRSTHVPHAHMQNFFDSIRLSRQPNCPFDLGYRVSIASRMAVDSYRLGRSVHWDSKTEEIV